MEWILIIAVLVVYSAGFLSGRLYQRRGDRAEPMRPAEYIPPIVVGNQMAVSDRLPRDYCGWGELRTFRIGEQRIDIMAHLTEGRINMLQCVRTDDVAPEVGDRLAKELEKNYIGVSHGPWRVGAYDNIPNG